MKSLVLLACVATSSAMLSAQTPDPAKKAAAATAPLSSKVYDWEKLAPVTTANGVRRDVFDGPTATVDKLHCHITTLKPGANSGEPRRHVQEEVIVIKEGLVEASIDGKTQIAGPGSVFHFASGAVTRMRNAGDGPATYCVIYFYTPLTPKS